MLGHSWPAAHSLLVLYPMPCIEEPFECTFDLADVDGWSMGWVAAVQSEIRICEGVESKCNIYIYMYIYVLFPVSTPCEVFVTEVAAR